MANSKFPNPVLVRSINCIVCGHETEELNILGPQVRWKHVEYDENGTWQSVETRDVKLRICPNCGTIKGYLEEKEGE